VDLYLFGQGELRRAYQKFGAHVRTIDGKRGVHFAVWAPEAERVSVIGDFNGWNPDAHPMVWRGGPGVWELFIPDVEPGTLYQYAIISKHGGYRVNKADPFAFFAETPPKPASRVYDLGPYDWGDAEWMAARARRQSRAAPIAVYEVHLGSWRRRPDGGFLNYRELATMLVDYVRRLGYSHIELLPITEHPFDVSWGYQTTGYYAPTSRFGTPDDFRFFVDYCHRHNLGVFLDWVPGHFAAEQHGLGFFDGSHLYEHADPRQGWHAGWGTYVFNFGRNEVVNFLLSSALFWLEEYHIDGLRIDAVAAMLYLDYDRPEGAWVPNRFGGRENLEAIAFLQRLNRLVHEEHPDVLTMAEESTAWPGITRPVAEGGLGFDLKWNMGWMHDTLSYFARDPIYRQYHHNELTFPFTYAHSECYILPLSHDEVVHLKRSLLAKMPGDRWQQFANLRALYAAMYTHPGKKLLFMGGEFGQWSEWSEARELDWYLLEETDHRALQRYVAALNTLYASEPALHELDCSPQGFAWIDGSDAAHSVIAFVRSAADPADFLIIIYNLTPVPHPEYRIGVPVPGSYHLRFNSDDPTFGGSGYPLPAVLQSSDEPWHGCSHSVLAALPPLSVISFKRVSQ
jgi:1,4-alpha-glucan branching enzyme